MTERFPEHGKCFVCGSANPRGLGATLWVDDNGTVFTDITFDEGQQGPPGHAHGGALAAVLDEVMGMATWQAGYQVLAVHLEVDYKQPVPLGQQVHITGQVTEADGRVVRTSGEVRLQNDIIAAVGHGVYVHAPDVINSFVDTWEAFPFEPRNTISPPSSKPGGS